MPLDLAKLKAALKDAEGSEEIIENVLSAVEEEKERGIELKRKSDREAKGLRAYKKALETIGFKPDEHDLDDFLTDLTEAKERLSSGDVTDKSELTKVMKSLEKLQKQFDEKDAEARELRDKGRKATIRSKLQSAIGDKIYGPTYVINDLITNGKVGLNESDEVVWIDGDDEVGFDEGLKSFMTTNADIVKNTQRPGGGSAGGGGNKSAKYSLDDFDKMSPEEIIANKEDVLSSLKAE